MITEIVLLLGVLCFLCIRNDFVHRRRWLVCAMVFWGSSRILTELTFRPEAATGNLRYDWGSLTSCMAAACLLLCLLCVFLACLPRRALPRPRADGGSDGSGAPSTPPEPASERLKKLVDERP